MSSSAAEKKREGSGGLKVFESKKEKKRRLILTDSDSDERPALPPRRKAVSPKQNGGSLDVVTQEEELRAEDKKMDMSLDAVKQKKEISIDKQEVNEDLKSDDKKMAIDMSLDSVKQKKETSIDKQEVNEEEFKSDEKQQTCLFDVNQEEASAAKNDKDEVSVVKERDMRSGAVIQREEGSPKKTAVNRRIYDEVIKFDKRKVRLPVVFKNREQPGNFNKSSTERRFTDEERHRDWNQREEANLYRRRDQEDLREDRRFGRSDGFKGRDEATPYKKKVTIEDNKVDRMWSAKKNKEDDNVQKRVTEKSYSRHEVKDDRKRPMSPDFAKKRDETGSDKKSGSERRYSDRELRDEKKMAVKPDVIQKREEVYSDKKKTRVLRSDKEELRFDKKRTARADVGRREEAGSSNKATESDSDEELEKMRFVRSDEVKKREETGRNNKKATELSDSKSDRKRGRETLDPEISLKRIKAELKQWQGHTKEIDGKKMKFDDHKPRDGRAESKGGKILASKSATPSRAHRDDLKEENSPVKSEKTFMPEAEKVGWMESSRQRRLRNMKDNTARAVGIMREESGSSRDKGIRMQGGKVHIQREDEEETESSTSSSSSTTASCSTPEHRPISTSNRVAEKSNSSAVSGKTQSMKNSRDEKYKSHESKRNLKVSPPEPKDKVMSSKKPGIVRKGKGTSSLSNPLLSIKNLKEGAVGRATVKRQITDQIKGILLSAGWRIDLRPRRGRNYEDQVYVPPTGGSGYWSITKAYAAFQKQSNHASDNKNKNLSGKSAKKSTGRENNLDETGSSSVVPVELLSMLKRNVVNKRRRRIEDDETEGSRSKKMKKTTKMKTLVVRGRKKSNSLVGSNSKQRGGTLLVRGSDQEAKTEHDDYVPYVWKRTVLSWIIDLGLVPLNGKVKYMSKKQARPMLEGQIVRDGILCSCCSKILTVSKFEIHAGSKLHQPYENILVEESGVSLLQCLIDAWEKQDDSERKGFYTLEFEGDDPNDDACGICGDGGDLICCDGCPSTFHQSCLDIEMLPPGEWHCMNCSCRYCGLVFEASAEGSDLPDPPLLSCYQCEKKYHQDCIPEEDAISTISINSPDSFCGKSCRKVFRRLQKLLGVKNDLEAGLSWRIVRRLDEDSHLSPFGLSKRAECNAKIAVSLAVMDECFLPIVDQRSGVNLIHNVVYNCGSNFNRLNYNGFYTFILERGEEIICAASVRIHGARLAEMPFIGTRDMYRRQGMCRRLLNGIESALCSLGVQKLIIPAISELKDTWTTVFRFKPLDNSQEEEVKSMNLLVFPETGLLQKPLLKRSSSQPADEADKVKPRLKHHSISNVEAESSVGPNLQASDETIVHPEDDVKDEVVPESFKTHASESQSPENKSPENAADPKLLIQLGAVGDSYQMDSLSSSKTELPSEDVVHNSDDLKIEDGGVALNSYASGESILDGNQDMKDQVTTLRPKLEALINNSEQCNSEIIIKSMDPVPNKFQAESNILASGEGADAIHEVGTEVATIKAKPDANDEDAESMDGSR